MPSLCLQAEQWEGGLIIDCPPGNLSMHTFRKLPVHKPSKVKTGINNKDNFLYYPIINYIASEFMIHQGRELSNGSGGKDVTLVKRRRRWGKSPEQAKVLN